MKNVALLGLLICLLSYGCAPESVERYHTGETQEQVLRLLNEREYQKAIFLIESRDGKNPKGPMGSLLAQAYLGKSGVEPLAFAAKLFESLPVNQTLPFPKCERGSISDLNIPEKCLFQRIYLHAPDPDSKDFQRARDLFRELNPNAKDTATWTNALIGFVEILSFTKRMGNLYKYAMGESSRSYTSLDLPWLDSQIKNSYLEGKNVLDRAEHSGERISKFLGAREKNLWFQRIEGSVQFADSVGMREFFNLLRENIVKPSDEIRYGEALDRLKKVLEEENSL